MKSCRTRCRGLTLLELMVVMAIVAILLGFAIPSYLGLIQTNRVAGEVNALVGDLQYARSEAVKRGLNVVVCTANATGTGCSNSRNWEVGWMVFVDADSSGTYGGTDPLLRVQKAWSSTDTFVAATPSANVPRITYNRDGFAVGLAGTATFTLHTTPLNGNATRCVAVNIAGRQSVHSAGTGACT